MHPRNVLVALIVGIVGLPVQSSAEQVEFRHLEIEHQRVKSTHQLAYHIDIEASFALLGDFHHLQMSKGRQFEVSLGAFSNGYEIILIHAEELSEKTGILDYSSLPQGNLSGLSFGMREQCVPVEAEAEIAENPQAVFLKSRGFKLSLPFHLMQFLIASDDGNTEVVISFGQKIESCAASTGQFRDHAIQAAKDHITVRRLP